MPKVRFHINKSLDKLIALQFINEKGGGIDFGRNIIKTHPCLKVAKINTTWRKIIVNKYFDIFYTRHKKEIISRLNFTKEGWENVEQDYLEATEKVFNGYHFPDGIFTAYISIINCNPRFLDSNSFQFFYKKKEGDALCTVAHELLHFIFFEFVKKNMAHDIKKISEDNLWDLSEIFNVIILRSAAYRNIIDSKYVKPYPNHKKYIRFIENSYKKQHNIELFIRGAIKYLNRQK